MPTGQRFAICHIWLWLWYLVVVQFVILLVEVWVVCWVFTKVLAKDRVRVSSTGSVCACLGSGDHHHMLQICHLGLYFWFLVMITV